MSEGIHKILNIAEINFKADIISITLKMYTVYYYFYKCVFYVSNILPCLNINKIELKFFDGN